MADPEPASDAPAAPAAPAEEPWTLGRVVQSTRLFLESTSVEDPSSTAAAVSSAAATADGHVASAIHTAYQGLKSLANETPPAIVLGFTCLAVGLPSARFGARPLVRNTGLSLLLAAALIYPDKLASRVPQSDSAQS